MPSSPRASRPIDSGPPARRTLPIRRALILGAVALVLPGLSDTPPAHGEIAEVAPQPSPEIRDLAFMSGCWEGEPDERGVRIEERYLPPSDNLILGTTRYLVGERAVQFEFTAIAADTAGPFLHPHPGGRPSPHRFRLTSFTTTPTPRAVFEAPENDFPKRIVYGLAAGADKMLVARIDNGEGSDEAAEWEMRAVPCEVGGRRLPDA